MEDKTLLNSVNQKIILVDSFTNFNNLGKIPPDSLIISFDYVSHKILSSKNINHSISDDYISDADFKKIEKIAYEFSEWYKISKFRELIEYNNVNLGSLFYPELHYFLVPNVKKFVELVRIFNRYPNAEYLTSSVLYEMMSILTNKIASLYTEKADSPKFLYDDVSLEVNLLNKKKKLSISRSLYFKIKGLQDNFIDSFYGSKKLFKGQKACLFVEFDTIKYKKIFLANKEAGAPLAIFNRRRPAIWNKESFSIIKNSHASIITKNAIYDKAVDEKIEMGLNQLRSKLTPLWENEKNFESFFVIEGFVFWKFLKKYFIQLYEKRSKEAVPEIELVREMLKKYPISKIIVLSEHGFNEQIVIQSAKGFNIPVTLLQHGVYYDAEGSFDFNKFAGVLPIYSDIFYCWGQLMKDYLKTDEALNQKTRIIGSPFHDGHFELIKNNLNRNQDYVLLATSSPSQNRVQDLLVKTAEKYEQTISEICKVVTGMNKKLIIKLHPSSEELDVTNIVEKINPEILVTKKGNIEDLIKSCEVFITIDLSTTILDAQILSKPVMSVSVKDYGFGLSSIFKLESCLQTSLENFQNTLTALLNSKDLKDKVIENGEKFVAMYVSNHGLASQKLLTSLKDS